MVMLGRDAPPSPSPRSSLPALPSSSLAGCGKSEDQGPRDPDAPDRQAGHPAPGGPAARLPRLRDEEHDARRRRRPGRRRGRRRARPSSPPRARDPTRRRALVDASATGTPASRPAVLLRAPLRAPILLIHGGDLPGSDLATRSARSRRAASPSARRRAGDARRRRADARRLTAHGDRRRDPFALGGGDRRACQRGAAGKPRREVIVASADVPGFAMPAARRGRPRPATRSCSCTATACPGDVGRAAEPTTSRASSSSGRRRRSVRRSLPSCASSAR